MLSGVRMMTLTSGFSREPPSGLRRTSVREEYYVHLFPNSRLAYVVFAG